MFTHDTRPASRRVATRPDPLADRKCGGNKQLVASSAIALHNIQSLLLLLVRAFFLYIGCGPPVRLMSTALETQVLDLMQPGLSTMHLSM